MATRAPLPPRFRTGRVRRNARPMGVALLLLLHGGADGAPVRAQSPGTAAASDVPGWIGISLDIRHQAGSPPLVRVSDVVAGGPAARAGLRPGDQVLRIDDRDVASERWMEVMEGLSPGRVLRFTVLRGQEQHRVRVPIEARPRGSTVGVSREVRARIDSVQVALFRNMDSILVSVTHLERTPGGIHVQMVPPAPPSSDWAQQRAQAAMDLERMRQSLEQIGRAEARLRAQLEANRADPTRVEQALAAYRVSGDSLRRILETADARPLLAPVLQAGYILGGIQATPINAGLAEYFGVRSGILVAAVVERSPAYQAGLRAGDVIVRIRDTPVRTREELVAAVAQPGVAPLSLTVVRKGQRLDIRYPR